MAEKPLTDAESEALRLRAGHPSIRAAAKAAGMDESLLRKRLNRAAHKGYAEPGAKYEVPSGHRVSGVSALVDAEGNCKAQWIKTKAGTVDPESIVATIKGAFEGWEARAEATPAPELTDDDLATVHIIPDAHLGQLSWVRETGINWNLKIATDVLGRAIERMISGSPRSKLGIVLGLGDLMHSDGYEDVTPTNRHPLDVDGRHPLVLRTAAQLIIRAVEAAKLRHENVIVRVLSGNHDLQSSIAVTLALSLYYANEPRVTVDDDPSYYWWHLYGNTLIGATHGDAARMKELPLIMASRNPKWWGQSKFRMILTGHVHHASSIEMSGVTVESFQAPIPSDAYHAKRGYGSNRSLTSITIHREHGEIARNKVNLVAA